MDLKYGMRTGGPLSGQSPGTPLPAPPRPLAQGAPAKKTTLSSHARGGVTVFFISCLLMFVCLLMSAQESLFSPSVRSFFAGGEWFFIIVMVLAIAYVARNQYLITAHRSSTVLREGSFDPAKYKKYRDYLDAVSIGAGVRAPALVVTDLATPLAYVHPRHGMAVTNELLEADLDAADIESIVAVLLARQIIDEGTDDEPRQAFEDNARKLGVNKSLVEIVRYEFVDDRKCLFHLLADTYAARLIGQPAAVKAAIMECDAMLEGNPRRPHGVEPRFIFVEPPLARQRNLMQVTYMFVPADVRNFNEYRDRVMQLRLENLDMLKLGARQPYEEVRGGLPVTQPPGWE